MLFRVPNLIRSNEKDEKINIFNIIDFLLSMINCSLAMPFFIIGMIEVFNNTDVDVEKIIWVILIIFLIKKFYVKFIEILKNRKI